MWCRSPCSNQAQKHHLRLLRNQKYWHTFSCNLCKADTLLVHGSLGSGLVRPNHPNMSQALQSGGCELGSQRSSSHKIARMSRTPIEQLQCANSAAMRPRAMPRQPRACQSENLHHHQVPRQSLMVWLGYHQTSNVVNKDTGHHRIGSPHHVGSFRKMRSIHTCDASRERIHKPYA